MMVATAALLVGCAPPSSEQRDWIAAMEQADGIVEVVYEYTDHGLVQPADHTVVLRLEDDLTASQVQQIVDTSCARDVDLTELTLRARSDQHAGSVSFVDAARHGCLAIEPVTAFAAATAAMAEMPSTYDGDFDLSGLTSARMREEMNASEATDAVEIVTTSTDKHDLLAALRVLRHHLDALPFAFFGWYDDDHDTHTSSTWGIDARLTADADFGALDPLISDAIDLGATDITVRDDELEVAAPTGSAAELQALIERADATGITLRVIDEP